MKPCKNPKCSTSTAIDEMTLTHGWGELDFNGFWEFECPVCTQLEKEKGQKKEDDKSN